MSHEYFNIIWKLWSKFFNRCSVLCFGSTDVDFYFFFVVILEDCRATDFIFNVTTEEQKIDLPSR